MPLARLLACAALLAAPLTAQNFRAVDEAVAKGIAQGIYPGAVVVIGRSDSVLYSKGYGHFTWAGVSPVPDPDRTLWDLASLTKVVATTASTAILVDRKELDLDAPVARYLPEFRGIAKDKVTVRMLLEHTSGLPAYVAFHKLDKTPQAARARLMATPLTRTPGVSALYSDLNAMLAGMVVERAGGMPLDSFTRKNVFGPAGMTGTLWRPTPADRTRTAPTGHYHNTALAGEVNDQNALVFGGVSGHAGLFSTGADMGRYAQSWLRGTRGVGVGAGWATTATLMSFLHGSGKSGSRVVGWDTPSLITGSSYSLYGKCATKTTIGHTGWTGTLVWIDPASNLFVVLLTNRSYDPKTPEASFKQLKEIRVLVSDAARKGSGEQCSP